MSVLRKKPYLEKLIADMSEEDIATLKTAMNTNNGDVYLSLVDNNHFISDDYAGFNPVVFQLDERNTKTGFLFYTEHFCSLVCYHRFQDLLIYEIDPVNRTYKQINEYATIEELRRTVAELGGGESPEITPELLHTLIEGSDYISVDYNDGQTKLLVELDQTKLDDEPTEDSDNLVKSDGVFDALAGKLDASKQAIAEVGGLVVPTQAPTDTALVSIETDREQAQVYVGTGLELGNSTSPYNLNVVGVEDSRSGDEFKLWVGTQAAYDLITAPDANTIYYIVG